MPMPPYLTLIGEKQKLITQGCSTLESMGNNYQLGREDQILVELFEQHFCRPKGAQSSGRVHGPVTITKVFDKATPLIFEAWRTGETLSLCKLDWYRISPSGFQEHFYTMVFKDVFRATDSETAEWIISRKYIASLDGTKDSRKIDDLGIGYVPLSSKRVRVSMCLVGS